MKPQLSYRLRAGALSTSVSRQTRIRPRRRASVRGRGQQRPRDALPPELRRRGERVHVQRLARRTPGSRAASGRRTRAAAAGAAATRRRRPSRTSARPRAEPSQVGIAAHHAGGPAVDLGDAHDLRAAAVAGAVERRRRSVAAPASRPPAKRSWSSGFTSYRSGASARRLARRAPAARARRDRSRAGGASTSATASATAAPRSRAARSAPCAGRAASTERRCTTATTSSRREAEPGGRRRPGRPPA